MRGYIFLLVAVLTCGIVSARPVKSDKVEIFVAVEGNDKAAGSEAKPVATLNYIDLRPNDVILEFDHTVVKNTTNLRKLIDEATSDRVPVVRFRNQKAETITVDCPKN